MSYEADRIRDLIHEVAAGELGDTDLVKLLDSVQHYTETSGRAITALFDAVAEHGDAILALSSRVEGAIRLTHELEDDVRTDFATRADLDDLRLEVREADSTPFDPPEAA